MTTLKIPKQMNNRDFTKKVVQTGFVIVEDKYNRKLVSAFGKTYYVDGDSCSKMTPEQWKESHEDFRND